MSTWLTTHQRSLFFALIMVTGAGVIAAFRIPVSLFPAVDFPRVVVSIEAGDRSIEQMAIAVTRPVEEALRSVPGVQSLRSKTSRGSAEISITFAWGDDMVDVTLEVNAAINGLLPALPADTRFVVRRMDPTVFPSLGFALSSASSTSAQLRDLAELRLRPLLASVEGVAAVEVLGGALNEYQVLIDPLKLQSYGLATEDVAQALTAANTVAAVGKLEDHASLYLVLVSDPLTSERQIGEVVITATAQAPVLVRDIGVVRRDIEPQWVKVTAQGREAVLVNIRQSPTADVVRLVKAVEKILRDNRRVIPGNVDIVPYYDQSQLVARAAHSVRDAIFVGVLLAVLVLYFFVRNIRVTLIVAGALPTVLAATCLILLWRGKSFNMMTLGGMAAAVGLVIDDAVVIVEHVLRRRRDMHTQNIVATALELARPLTASSLATVIIFLPLIFVSGVTGEFFKALAFTVAATLLLSYVYALLITPIAVARLLAHAPRDGEKDLSGWIKRYHTMLLFIMRRPLLVIAVVIALIGAGYSAYQRVGSGFMPIMDEGGFVLDYVAAPGMSLTETDRLLQQVEAIIRATPDVASYSRRTGLQLGGGLTEANEGDFFIRLKDHDRRPAEIIRGEVRARVEHAVPGLSIETMQLMEDVIGDLTAVPQPVEVKLFGAEPPQLNIEAAKVVAAIRKIDGLVEVRPAVKIVGDAIQIEIDRLRAGLEGLDVDLVVKQVTTLIGGTVVSRVEHGERQIGLRLWSPAEVRNQDRLLAQLQLRAPDGHYVPLNRIAALVTQRGQVEVVHDNLQPMVAVTARIEGRDLGSSMREVKSTIANLQLASGVRVEYGGLYAEQLRSFRQLAMTVAGALLLTTLLLLYVYENVAIVFSILVVVTLSASAVFTGLAVSEVELNLSAMMGLTMTVGIVTELAIFYFAEIERGRPLSAYQLMRAGRARLRPILMTSLIAILALLPLALGWGEGSAMQQPLAIAIVSGLLAAAPLVLLIMPALCLTFGRIRAWPNT